MGVIGGFGLTEDNLEVVRVQQLVVYLKYEILGVRSLVNVSPKIFRLDQFPNISVYSTIVYLAAFLLETFGPHLSWTKMTSRAYKADFEKKKSKKLCAFAPYSELSNSVSSTISPKL